MENLEQKHADFVVIGSGGAGLCAALVAAAKGLHVVVLEKTDLIGGTTAVSGGTLWIPNNHHEPEAGVEDSASEAYAYLQACIGDAGDPKHTTVLAEQGRNAIQFLEEHAGLQFLPMPAGGGSMDYRPWLPGAKVGGRGLTSPETHLEALGDLAEKVRLVDSSEWTFDSRDYITERMHLDAPGTERPGASLFSPPADGPKKLPKSVGRGAGLIAQLTREAVARGVEIHLGVRAESLIADGSTIIGVHAVTHDNPVEYMATRGVMVATGGYSPSEELRNLWLSRKIDFSCELETNSGDGHLMGMEIGAQTAGMGDAWWMPHVPLGTDNAILNTAGSREDRCLPHTLIVNATGKRFMNESVNYHDFGGFFDSVVGGFSSNFPAWLLFDQAGAEKYAMLAWKTSSVSEGEPLPEWLRTGETIEEIASALAIDPDTLNATVKRFNEFAATGIDEDFHRGESLWDQAWGDPKNKPNPSLGALSKGPFYAIRMHAGALSTRGGLRIDQHGRVLSVRDAAPIPGLYAAGNSSNGGPASAYPGPGATLGAAFTFAYVAGLHVSQR